MAGGDFKEDDDMAVDDGMDPNIMEVLLHQLSLFLIQNYLNELIV